MNTFIDILEKHNLQIHKYKKGETISLEGDMCQCIRVLKSGQIIISSITKSGQEIIYKKLGSGDMFGNNLLFSNNPFYRGDILCLEDSLIYELDKNSFLDLLQKDRNFAELFLRYQSEDSKRLNQQIKIASLQTVEEKIFYLLQINNHNIKISSVTDLSRQLNISREATSRVLHSLIKDGKLKLTGNNLTDK